MNAVLKKISENPFVNGILVVPSKAMYSLGKKSVRRFFRNPKSWGFAGRVGMTLACAGLLAAGIGFAPFGPAITKALVWIAMQIPINIVKDSAMATAKKEWKHLKNSTHKFKIPRLRTFGAIALIGTGVGVGVYLAGPSAVGAAVLRGLLIAATFSIKTSRGIVKGNSVRALKKEGIIVAGGSLLPVVNKKIIMHSLHQMKSHERREVLEAVHKKFGQELSAVFNAAQTGELPPPAVEQQNMSQAAPVLAQKQAKIA